MDGDIENTAIARSRAPAVGDTIGSYRLVRELGQGATGRVFEVEHARIGRRAAMKIVHRDGVAPGVVNRLFVEAQAVNRIDHPNIVEITDILVPDAQQSDHALVMELLEGRSLADVVSADGPLSPQRFLPILAQVCAGLAAVHRAGFVHRDLKPENVFLVESVGNRDFVKLLDFGLVKAVRGDGGSGRATVEGMFMGSPAYASPEQATGKPVDWRTDIYAVGVMLHELTTGELPFQAENIADLLMKQVTVAAPRLSAQWLATDLGRALDAIIQGCLVKDPGERALSAAQLADMFRRLAIGGHVTLERVRDPRGRRRGLRGRRRLMTIAPMLVVGAIAFLAVRHWRVASQVLPPAGAPATAVVSRVPAPTADPKLAADEMQAGSSSRVDGSGSKAPRRSRRSAPDPRSLDKAMTLDPYR